MGFGIGYQFSMIPTTFPTELGSLSSLLAIYILGMPFSGTLPTGELTLSLLGIPLTDSHLTPPFACQNSGHYRT